MSAWEENERLRPLAIANAYDQAARKASAAEDLAVSVAHQTLHMEGLDIGTKAWAAVHYLQIGADLAARERQLGAEKMRRLGAR